MTGQLNYQAADPKTNAAVFLFLPNAHYLKTNLVILTTGTFAFARNTNRPFAIPKLSFFANLLPAESENSINL